jgi:outer membrane protein assembly factor BamB
LAVLTVLAAGACAIDWNRFRGANGSGQSDATGVPVRWSQTENLVWKVKLPGPGSSSPILHGGRIYLTAYTGYNVPGRPPGDPADLRRHLLCIDGRSGAILWNTPTAARLPEQDRIRDGHGYATSTPAVDADRVYCFYGKSGVFAFDHSGKQIWHADVGTGLNSWGSAASPVLHGDCVIINASVESGSLVALDKATGKERWRAEGVKESWSTPVVARNAAGRDEVLIPVIGRILAFDPATGRQIWSCDTGITWYMVPGIVVHDGVAYCFGGRSGIVGLAVQTGGSGDVTSTHRLWTTRKGVNVSSPVVHDGRVYWMNDQNETAYCARADTGAIVYEQRISRAGQVYSSPVLIEGRIHYTSRDGRTFVVAAKPEFELLATNDLRDGSLVHASPAVAPGRLYFRSDTHLYCVGR